MRCTPPGRPAPLCAAASRASSASRNATSNVNDEFSVAHEIQELDVDLLESRLLRELLAREAVHLDRTLVDVPVRIQIAVERTAGQPAIDHLDAADLDDAMLLLDLEAGGLRIEYDLAHQPSASRQHLVDRTIGEGVDVLIAFISGMSFYPMPFDILRRRGGVEPFP